MKPAIIIIFNKWAFSRSEEEALRNILPRRQPRYEYYFLRSANQHSPDLQMFSMETIPMVEAQEIVAALKGSKPC